METEKEPLNICIGTCVLSDFPLLLAPMEDVSDPPFRVLCREHGADLVFTEFISSEGLIRAAVKSRKKLDILAEERPVGIQLFGGDEDTLAEAAQITTEVQPNLIDINFGCPVKKVVCKGAGAAVLKDIPTMERVTREVVRHTSLPVTVKTRLGWDEGSIHIVEVAERLQDAGAQALTVHARTRAQMYKGEADWRWIERIKNNPRFRIPLFGNGDINSPEKAWAYKQKYPVDGIMIGRAAIGNPWIFREVKHYFRTGERLPPPSFEERVAMCIRHLHLSVLWKGERMAILEMRRHYAPYFRGLASIKELRAQLNAALSFNEVQDILYATQAHRYV